MYCTKSSWHCIYNNLNRWHRVNTLIYHRGPVVQLQFKRIWRHFCNLPAFVCELRSPLSNPFATSQIRERVIDRGSDGRTIWKNIRGHWRLVGVKVVIVHRQTFFATYLLQRNRAYNVVGFRQTSQVLCFSFGFLFLFHWCAKKGWTQKSQ